MVGARRVVAGLAVAAFAAAALVGCGSDGGSDDASGDTTVVDSSTTEAAPTTDGAAGDTEPDTEPEAPASTTEAAPAETTTTESSEGRDTETSELDNLSDGVHVGYVAGVENGVVEGQAVQVILFDQVEVLTGQAAIDAAAEDGETLDTDYYVRDPDASLVSVAVAPDASVSTLQGGSSVQVPSSVTDIAGAGVDLLHEIDTSTVRDVTLVNSIAGYYLA